MEERHSRRTSLCNRDIVDRHHSSHREDRDRRSGRGDERQRERSRSRDHDRSRHRHHEGRERSRSRERSHHHRQDEGRERENRDRHEGHHRSRTSAMSSTSSNPSSGMIPDINSAVIAAMEAAKQLSQQPAPTKPRVSRFSNSVMTRKIYFPQHYHDIDYSVIFNSPWKIEVETDTHTTLSIGGSSTIVTDLDEPQHVIISYGNDESASQAEERIQTLFAQPEMARRLVQQYSRKDEKSKANIMAQTVGTIYNQADLVESKTEYMEIPFTVVGLVIGQQGRNIRQLREIYGVELKIQQDKDVTDGNIMRTVTIIGREEMIAKTKEAINTIIQSGRSDVLSNLQNSRDGFEKIKVPNDKVGLVIGRQGAVINEIKSQTCTQIQVPHDPDRDDPTVRSVVITGDPKNVLEAKRRIQAIIDGQMGSLPVGVPTTQMLVPDDKVGLVIGKGGQIIKEIQAKTKAHVQIPGKPVEGSNPPVRAIIIAGTEEQMQAVKDAIQQIIGTTAGTARDYNEQPAGMHQPWGSIQSMFSQATDFNQMQQFMQMQMQMQMQMAGSYYGMPNGNGAVPPPPPPPLPPGSAGSEYSNASTGLPPPPPPPPPSVASSSSSSSSVGAGAGAGMGGYAMGQAYPGYGQPSAGGMNGGVDMYSPVPDVEMAPAGNEEVPPGLDEAPPGL